MVHPIRVAHVDELPPGKGKRLLLAGLSVTVFNHEGRFAARVQRPPNAPPGPLLGVLSTETTCVGHGQIFDVTLPDSPGSEEEEPGEAMVTVEGEFVVLLLDEAV